MAWNCMWDILRNFAISSEMSFSCRSANKMLSLEMHSFSQIVRSVSMEMPETPRSKSDMNCGVC